MAGTDKLPDQLLKLFAPRPLLRYLPHIDKPLAERKTARVDSIGPYLDALRDYKANDTSVPTESDIQKRERIKREKKEAYERRIEEGVKQFNPSDDPNIKGDPFKTLFVARLDWNVESKELEREFGRYGPILRVSAISSSINRVWLIA